ncbi:hypothetical protein AV530_000089 [Patagioenas fasciata monilis]|uniref:Uncharacterized protein n=1 Tax=Patagioenas fasciata monilis TaxID=372326 RepID=A0A1V4K048_PATFA|nr:hypothetical protein AV530_000089 [Patagioenas fasciata monilis]
MVMQFDAGLGFNCLLKYSVIIIKLCSRIGKSKMEEAVESFSELSNTLVQVDELVTAFSGAQGSHTRQLCCLKSVQH